MVRVAIVGAGMSGLTCARALDAAGFAVSVFDKSRGPGGRMSTRRRDGRQYDHGAQYFTAKSPDFQAQVDVWKDAGVVDVWSARFATLRRGAVTPRATEHPRYVGAPRMSALTRYLSAGLDLKTQTRIEVIHPGAALTLVDTGDQSVGPFTYVVVSTPAAQAVPLVAAAGDLAAIAAVAHMDPCLAAMVTFSPALAVDFDAAWVEDSPLKWIARDASKPGRPPFDSWVLHASPAWSAAHIAEDFDTIAASLVDALHAATGITRHPIEMSGHRWRYAQASGPFSAPCFFDPRTRIGMCGDWCGGARVEGAWRSGLEMARRLQEHANR